MSLLNCSVCNKTFLKDQRHINENKKFAYKSYCSLNCQRKSKSKQIVLTCERKGCIKTFKRSPHTISFRNFCSRSCAIAFNNTVKARNPMGLNGNHKNINNKASCNKTNTSYYCKYCGNKTSSRRNYCSTKCWGRSHEIPKEILIGNIIALSLELGRTPTRREFKGSTSCRKQFGSWSKALIAAGLTPNRSLNQRMYKRRRCLAKDGHICNSVSEMIIDNWFHKNGITHFKEVPYPKGKFTADWCIVSDILVEYFGLANDSKRYDEEIRKKQQICKEYQIKLIEIYSKNLFPKDNLKTIFKSYIPEVSA